MHIAEALTSVKSTANETDKSVVVQEGDKYGYAEDEDYAAIAAKFDLANDFFDGLASVSIDRQWGFIDGEGKTAIAMKFDPVSSFHSGLGAVKIDKKWGFIDRH